MQGYAYIQHYIVDNDVHGTTGIDTVHCVDITIDGNTVSKTYGLLEILDGRFSLNTYLKPHLDSNAAIILKKKLIK